MSAKKTIPKAEKSAKTNAKGKVAPPAEAAEGKTPGNTAEGKGASPAPKAKRAAAR